MKRLLLSLASILLLAAPSLAVEDAGTTKLTIKDSTTRCPRIGSSTDCRYTFTDTSNSNIFIVASESASVALITNQADTGNDGGSDVIVRRVDTAATEVGSTSVLVLDHGQSGQVVRGVYYVTVITGPTGGKTSILDVSGSQSSGVATGATVLINGVVTPSVQTNDLGVGCDPLTGSSCGLLWDTSSGTLSLNTAGSTITTAAHATNGQTFQLKDSVAGGESLWRIVMPADGPAGDCTRDASGDWSGDCLVPSDGVCTTTAGANDGTCTDSVDTCIGAEVYLEGDDPFDMFHWPVIGGKGKHSLSAGARKSLYPGLHGFGVINVTGTADYRMMVNAAVNCSMPGMQMKPESVIYFFKESDPSGELMSLDLGSNQTIDETWDSVIPITVNKNTPRTVGTDISVTSYEICDGGTEHGNDCTDPTACNSGGGDCSDQGQFHFATSGYYGFRFGLSMVVNPLDEIAFPTDVCSGGERAGLACSVPAECESEFNGTCVGGSSPGARCNVGDETPCGG